MATLSRNQILQVSDLPRESVAVPEWGGDVFLRVLTGAEMLSLSDLPKDQFGGALLTLALCDDGGSPLFNRDEVSVLMAKNHAVLGRLVSEAIRINRMQPETAEKNS